MTRIGILGSPRDLDVSTDGTVSIPGRDGSVRVWIGAEDGWHDPARTVATRQSRVGLAPVIETRVRVAGGDAHITAFGAYVHPDAFSIDVVNDSGRPFVAAFVLDRLAPHVEAPGRVGGAEPHVVVPHPPRDTVRAPDLASLWERLTRAVAEQTDAPDDRAEAIGSARDRYIALVYPVVHGARARVVIQTEPGALGEGGIAAFPTVDQVNAGWRAQIARGLTVGLPDEHLQHAIEASQVELLLAQEVEEPAPDLMVALEDWGFDAEAAAMYERLGFLDRRRVATRPVDAAPWSHIERLMRTMSPVCTFPDGPAELLNHARSLLAFERPDGTVDLLTHLPPTWVGQSIEVHHAPTRGGWVSYAVRWHGSRPAVLWECERPGLRLHVPGLDTVWMTDEPSGEALLAPVAV